MNISLINKKWASLDNLISPGRDEKFIAKKTLTTKYQNNEWEKFKRTEQN